ncbi:hypothetical protein V8C42DRAFT_355512 [Trichoderma barbatum]
MPSWVIVGATRGIGITMAASSDSQNEVFALIRSQKTAGPLNELTASRKNIHETAEQIGKATGGRLDVLIYNAFFRGDSLKVNALHLFHTVNALLPLIKRGTEKKIIYISSVSGDIEVTRISELSTAVGYSASKAAGAIDMTKYASELKSDGILTLSISPGWVVTDSAKDLITSPAAFTAILSALKKSDPNVKGMISPKESVESMLSVIKNLDGTNSGRFLSHKGNLSWF